MGIRSTCTTVNVPQHGTYWFESQDLLAAVAEIAPLAGDHDALVEHMVNGVCLFDGSETATGDLYVEHALVARAWQRYLIRTGDEA